MLEAKVFTMPCLETTMGESADSDMDAFIAMQTKLEKEHPHEVAIIQDGKLLAIGKDYDEALDRALANSLCSEGKSFHIHRVGSYEEELLCPYYRVLAGS